MKFYNEICEKLENGTPFRMSRWGDGEWGCMAGWTGVNRDGNEYSPDLRRELIEIFESKPDYYIGIQHGVFYNDDLREYVIRTLFWKDTDYVDGDIIHKASEFGYLDEFVTALKDRCVVVIGAEYFNKLPYKLVTTPGTNSYSDNYRILQDAAQYAMNPVYLVANAMNSNVIIDKLPDSATAIDIGSVFDPYLGRPRASYQHNMKADWLW